MHLNGHLVHSQDGFESRYIGTASRGPCATHFLSASQPRFNQETQFPLSIDIPGHPGTYTDYQLFEIHTAEGVVGERLIQDVLALFPKRQLIVTRNLVAGGDLPRYEVSTVGGVSGAPVLLNGQVIGTHLTLRNLRHPHWLR